jgi:uncharacterized protein
MSYSPNPHDSGNPYGSEPPFVDHGYGVSQQERTWGMLAHLSALLSYWIPFGNFIGPLVVWLIKKDEMPFVDDQGKEALNFQITMLIATAVVAASICIGIGFILLPLLIVYALVLTIIAAVKANQGIVYRYPLTLRLIA